MKAEHSIVVICPTQNPPVRQQIDVSDAVGRHVATVTNGGLERLELIAVIATKAIPGSEPHKALLIL